MKTDYLQEASQGYTPRTAMEEAARCLLCYDAPCSKSCPAGTDPAKFIRSLRFRNVKGAAECIRTNNPLGGSCARVCPYDNLCEQACSRCGIDKPIDIGRLQRFAVEQEEIYGMKTLAVEGDKPYTVACIGGGPASLAAAAQLAQAGYKVTIYEKNEKLGGYLTYGIPSYRLPEKVVDFDISQILSLGIKVINNTEVGKDISLEEIRKSYDAVLIAIGLWNSKIPDIPGNTLPGVTNARDFLKAAKESKGALPIGNRVIVIGGGDVAMDCAASAKKMGAEKVAIWYRRTIDECPANKAEVAYVNSLGIPMTTDMAPKAVEGDGKVEFMTFAGRDGLSEARVACDTVIFAIGQGPEALEGASKGEKGYILPDKENGVFVAGDILYGGRTVVEAVANGKLTAAEIVSYLERKEQN